MNDIQFLTSVNEWLWSLWDKEAVVKVEDGNVIFSTWTDSFWIPVPDGVEDIPLDAVVDVIEEDLEA